MGPKYGRLLGGIREALSPEHLDGNKAKRELDRDGVLKLTVDGVDVELTPDDLLIDMTQKPGYYCVSEGELSVALDVTLTPELIDEGFVREIISKIQTMRKESDFVVTDRINIFADPSDTLRRIIDTYPDRILPAVLGNGFELTDRLPEGAREWDINGERLVMFLERV